MKLIPAAVRATILVVTTAIVLIAAGGTAVHAEDADAGPREFRFEFGVFGGYPHYPLDHGLGRYIGDPTGLSPAPAGLFGARLTLNFNNWIGIEGEGSIAPTHNRGGSTAP